MTDPVSFASLRKGSCYHGSTVSRPVGGSALDYGFEVRNKEGERNLKFCAVITMTQQNTLFKKGKIHIVTYESGPPTTHVDC